ncbi:Signal transduction histidine kinase [Amycolatopsis xylanica]|uniref:histidine kinase n=1 Tax=Amycolatopsis xylanica TaxID=589385 RepID=A0A1H2UG79_9PSEU|nr:sensor histidine kinase [Amycolatopsis xylanica]SDW55100.1 Signal transduction histidine kinase [Amycolatopsis xylanica]
MADQLRWRDVLRWTVYAGTARPHWPRPAGLLVLRVAAVLGIGSWAGFIAAVTAITQGRGALIPSVLGIATLVPAVIALWSPLWAWRALVVLILATPPAYENWAPSWGWSWSPGLALAAVLVLYLVGETHDQPVLACVALLSVGAMAPYVHDWRDLVLLAALTSVPLFFGNLVRQRRLAGQQRVAEETRLAVLEERTRIARELHDIVAHHMSVLALRTDSARYRFPGLTDDLKTEFAALTDTAREGMTELRRLLGVLRMDAAPTSPQPDLTRVTELVDRVRALGTDCALDRHGDFDALPAGVGLSLYRIVQEALSNAARHAPGAAIRVELRVEADAVHATVRNGPGEPAGPIGPPGHGLLGMRERVAMLSGKLETGATPDGGFRVAVTIPLEGAVS